jgi:putative ABC transport system permease protein
MFFRQIKRNAAKNRKNNGLFFGSLVIAVIAFYTLLSMDKQDIMRFLKTIESDAVRKLLQLIPVVYGVSLFFVFFLVYFSCHYQLNERKKELGLYLMLGMKKSRLFAMLMSETLLNSLISLVIGIPAALFLTEAISLITVRAAGLDIIGHEVTWSFPAVAETAAGFIIVQLTAMLILSTRFANTEPAKLLNPDVSETQGETMGKERKGDAFFFAAGCILLAAAYGMGVMLFGSFDVVIVLAVLILGTAGTFLLYRGAGAVIGRHIQKKGAERSGLYAFTGRQIQENILCQHKTLAVSSLLLLIALSCVSYGIGTVVSSQAATSKTTDFSIQGDEEKEDWENVLEILESRECRKYISGYYPVYLGRADAERHEVSVDGLKKAVVSIKDAKDKEMQDNVAEYMDSNEGYEYFIALSSYNDVLEAAGKGKLSLKDKEIGFYTSMKEYPDRLEIYRSALKDGAYIELDGEQYQLSEELYYDNVVADRQITLEKAFIVPDELYMKMVEDSDRLFCYNAMLRPELTEKEGFMQTLEKASEIFREKGLVYESYLSGIGRRMFYTVAGSYITIYLGILFMIIANTSIALKYLMQQQGNRKRYRTLMMLGADIGELCRSSAKQIYLFSGMVLLVSSVSSVFAIWTMFKSFLSLPEGVSPGKMIALTGAAFAVFVATQMIYVMIIERAGRKDIRNLNIR